MGCPPSREEHELDSLDLLWVAPGRRAETQSVATAGVEAGFHVFFFQNAAETSEDQSDQGVVPVRERAGFVSEACGRATLVLEVRCSGTDVAAER